MFTGSRSLAAEAGYRNRGHAFASLQLMLSYATSTSSPPLPLPMDRLVARIGDKNIASIRLFQKLGFVVTKRVTVFEEVELRFRGKEGVTWISGEQMALGE